MRNGGAKYEKKIQSRMLQQGASREVMVKITGSANRPRGVKNEINYIAREGEITLRDNNRVEYHIADREQRKEAYESLIDDEDKKQYTHDRSPNLVHNMVFLSPKIADVSERDMIKAAEETLREKYPENRVLMAYHTDKEHHPHVHALLRIPDNGGKRINIRKKDLRELREKFSGNLQKIGYNVKCTHKYDFGKKEQLKREPDRLRNLFEVVEFGRTNYLFDPKNKQQNYITLRTLKNKTEMTRWGSNIADEIKREGVKVGSVIKMRKEGETTVKVPLIDGQGNQQGWSDHKRNNWRIENQGAMGIKPAPFDKLKPLDTSEQLLKQQRGFSLFKQNQEATVKLQEKQKLGIRVGIFKFQCERMARVIPHRYNALMKKTFSHHDSLFKKFLGDITIARDFLQIHLPEKLRQLCDFSTLAMESGSFIEPDLRSQCSDMLYSMKTTASNDSYVYCLIEHQSSPEKLMAFRLMRYAVAAMQRHLEQGNDTLPVVIPLLFYQGNTSPYPYSTHCLDCFADPELAKSVYMQAFPLVDVTAIPDEEIVTHRHVALMELVMKHIRTRDMLELSQDIASLLNQWVLQPELFRGLICYIVERGNTSDAKQFLHQIAEKATDYREVVMTIAEQLRQEGEQQGILKGREEGIHLGEQRGIEKGKQESARTIARQLLANGVDRAIVKMSTGLSDAEINALMD